MPVGNTRAKILRGFAKARAGPHRYTLWRWSVGVAFTLAVALLPATGTLRFDLWSGRHMLLGERATLVEAAKAFVFPFVALNVAIALATRWIGRYLCGFVCPYGAVARLAEWLSLSAAAARGGARRRAQIARGAVLASVSLVLASIVFAFWIDWRVFSEGTPPASALAACLLLLGALAIFLTVDQVGLRFCRDWCPSGVYFAVLGGETSNGIELAHPADCSDCRACENVCPMDLAPRALATSERAGSGFYPDGFSGHAACIRCGDCVVACEGSTAKAGTPTPLRLGFLREHCADRERTAVHGAESR